MNAPCCPLGKAIANGENFVCRCLQVTEDEVVSAVHQGRATTVKEIICMTGAGGGCTACVRSLKLYLPRNRSTATATVFHSSSDPICSVR